MRSKKGVWGLGFGVWGLGFGVRVTPRILIVLFVVPHYFLKFLGF